MDDQLVPQELLIVGATTLALFSATALLLAAIPIWAPFPSVFRRRFQVSVSHQTTRPPL